MFEPTSRYYNLPKSIYTTPNGNEVIYISRRFLPDAAKMTVIAEHAVTQGDRLDNITARYLGDPQQFWRVVDANNAMHPDDLITDIGLRLRIPYPQL
jgi:hypothetical protein